uniref:Uncharacterized protein n=3 Tax=Halorubrum distributum TaxID=29283 RepID=A0A2R2NVR5_9EURY|nr:hypothetical protein [Halorubrum litoreum]
MSLSDRLDTVDGVSQLGTPDDVDAPGAEVAPFELSKTWPLTRQMGATLTEPEDDTDDADPGVVFRLRENPKVSAWLARFQRGDESAYILTCWDGEKEFYFEVPREVAVSALEQAVESHLWAISRLDSNLLGALKKEL